VDKVHNEKIVEHCLSFPKDTKVLAKIGRENNSPNSVN